MLCRPGSYKFRLHRYDLKPMLRETGYLEYGVVHESSIPQFPLLGDKIIKRYAGIYLLNTWFARRNKPPGNLDQGRWAGCISGVASSCGTETTIKLGPHESERLPKRLARPELRRCRSSSDMYRSTPSAGRSSLKRPYGSETGEAITVQFEMMTWCYIIHACMVEGNASDFQHAHYGNFAFCC